MDSDDLEGFMTFSEALHKISPSLHLRACTLYYSVRYGLVSNLINAIYFLKLAFQFARGKLILITVNYPTSNGGYKYMSLVISKCPVSATHTYDDL